LLCFTSSAPSFPYLLISSHLFSSLPFASASAFPLHVSCLLLTILHNCLFQQNISKLRDGHTANVLIIKPFRRIPQYASNASDADDENEQLDIVQCQLNWHHFRPEKTLHKESFIMLKWL
jgi:hypothetical protein